MALLNVNVGSYPLCYLKSFNQSYLHDCLTFAVLVIDLIITIFMWLFNQLYFYMALWGFIVIIILFSYRHIPVIHFIYLYGDDKSLYFALGLFPLLVSLS